MNYTPIPLHGDTHIPEYGLHGPMIDGLLAARHLLSPYDEIDKLICLKIDRYISDIKVYQAKIVRQETAEWATPADIML